MRENQRELQRQFREQQEKYVYYVLALSVSAIGFAIYKSSDVPLKWSQIPLGLSVISWGLSVFCGLRFLQYVLSSLYANNAYLDTVEGRNPAVGDEPKRVEAEAKTLLQAIDSNGTSANRFFHGQWRLFFIGIGLFIVWHVWEMFELTVAGGT